MNTTVALFPEDRPRFVVGADTFLNNERSPFLAIHANAAGVCLTWHGISRDELQAIATRILDYLAQPPAQPDDDADAEGTAAEARRIAMERFDQMLAEVLSIPSPTGTLPD